MGLITPTVLDMMKSGYYTESYEALRRVIACLVCKDSYKLKIEDMVAVDKIVKIMGRKEYSIWIFRKIRSMLELKDLAEINLKQGKIKVVDRSNVHTKYKQMKPEEILVLAIKDKDILNYLISTYTFINKDLGVLKFNIRIIDNTYTLLKYCEVVDKINGSELQKDLADLIHKLVQSGYDKREIFDNSLKYVKAKLEV